jgi:flagellar basal-body rod modification protein FlgD
VSSKNFSSPKAKINTKKEEIPMSNIPNINSPSQPGFDAAGLAARASGTDSAKKTESKPNDLANKEVFLQLLIAQIKNQNPAQPADSIQYITQLSQFTGVEQLVDIKQQMQELNQKLTPKPEVASGGN